MSATISLDEVIQKYEDGQSPYQIAKDFNTYPNRIRRMLEKNGTVMRNRSQAQKKSLESGVSKHPTEGKKRTQEEKIKISESLSNYWENLSDEEREKRSEVSREVWDRLTDEQKHDMNSKGIEAIRKAATEGSKTEKMLRDAIEEAGYLVDFHNKNLIPSEKLEIDLYIPALKCIIEVDGPSHFEPIWGADHLQKQEAFDLKKNGTLLSRGFVVIRVKAIRDPSVSRDHALVQKVLSILNSVEQEFPEESKRFIEVEL